MSPLHVLQLWVREVMEHTKRRRKKQQSDVNNKHLTCWLSWGTLAAQA